MGRPGSALFPCLAPGSPTACEPPSPGWKTARGSPSPRERKAGRGTPSPFFPPAPLCRDQAGKFPGRRGAQSAALRQTLLGAPVRASPPAGPADPAQERARRRQAVLGACAAGPGAARSRPPRRSPLGPRAPRRALTSQSGAGSSRRAPTSLPARLRARGPPEWGGRPRDVSTEGPPWVPLPSRRAGASRAGHSGQGAGRGPWASECACRRCPLLMPVEPARDAPPLAETAEAGRGLRS